jgi:sucrose-6-phosphate hydrolase SacC (GH32 family)
LSDFGPAGATGGVWECPDLFELPIDDDPSRKRWVLDVDINPGGVAGGSGGQYFVGTFDGVRFTNDNPAERTLWVDYGKDFYATLSFSDAPDGRRIWMAWISSWLYANDEPTAIWRGARSIPRTVALRRFPEGVRLVQSPVAELTALRATQEAGPIPGAITLVGPSEIDLEVSRGGWKEVGFRLKKAGGEEVVVGLTAAPLELFVDRRRSRATPFHEAYPGRHAGPITWRGDTLAMRVLFDQSVLEIFGNDGQTVITERVYPMRPYDRLELVDESRAIKTAKLWPLRSVWPTR